MREIGPEERIVFPPFHLDLAAGRLACGAEAIELPPKAFSLLKYLAERPGQLVSKEELLQNLWPGVHVGAGVLKVAIARIRKVLNDPCREPRFIETAHRRGYRFIAETEAPARLQDTAEMPQTHCTRSGDGNLASQVIGEASPELVFVMGSVSHLVHFWTEPSCTCFVRRLDDVMAVIDAVGSKRIVLCAVSEGGAMSALCEAADSEPAAGLVTTHTSGKWIRDARCRWGPTKEEQVQILDHIRKEWGGPVALQELVCRSRSLPWLLMLISDNRRQPT